MAAASILHRLRDVFGDVRPSIAIAGLLVVFLTLWSALSTLRQYNRLREFKGPRLAALSKWWLIKKVGGGRAYLDFWEVTKQYGIFPQQSHHHRKLTPQRLNCPSRTQRSSHRRPRTNAPHPQRANRVSAIRLVRRHALRSRKQQHSLVARRRRAF